MVRVDQHPSGTTGSQSLVPVWSKLVPPAPRAGLITRTGLQSMLQVRLAAKLCLLEAPAGFGKTTLLAQWQTAGGEGRVAWVSLDEADNDPTRFWVYVVKAFRTVEPGVGAAALQALQRASLDHERVVLPSLLNDLSAVASPLVLVLDDYHLITNPACHQSLTFFLDHLPVGVHVVLATRVDPPLPLARMRARREMTELRVAELQFTSEEAAALLNAAMGLRLTAGDVERLTERTEGWAAGLYLAGLSLRGREDPSAFVASFQGDNRHVADYLAGDVLERQPSEITTFLLRTSVLRRLSGPLCDAVLEAEGSTGRLEEFERSNLFLVPLDDRREWYRYHQLFGELLHMELASREPALLATLHRRAAAWHRTAGDIDEAIYHAAAAGEVSEAGELIASHWLAYWRRGRGATVARWLEGAARGGDRGRSSSGLRRRLDWWLPRYLQAGMRTLVGRDGGSQLEGQAARGHQVAGLGRRPGTCRCPVRRCRSCGPGCPAGSRACRSPVLPVLVDGAGSPRPRSVPVGEVGRGAATARGGGRPRVGGRTAVRGAHRAGGAVAAGR